MTNKLLIDVARGKLKEVAGDTYTFWACPRCGEKANSRYEHDAIFFRQCKDCGSVYLVHKEGRPLPSGLKV